LILDWQILEVALVLKLFELGEYGEKLKEECHWAQT